MNARNTNFQQAMEQATGKKLKKEYREAGVDFGEGGTEVDPWDHIPKMEQ